MLELKATLYKCLKKKNTNHHDWTKGWVGKQKVRKNGFVCSTHPFPNLSHNARCHKHKQNLSLKTVFIYIYTFFFFLWVYKVLFFSSYTTSKSFRIPRCFNCQSNHKRNALVNFIYKDYPRNY